MCDVAAVDVAVAVGGYGVRLPRPQHKDQPDCVAVGGVVAAGGGAVAVGVAVVDVDDVATTSRPA